MTNLFKDNPVINSAYAPASRHFVLDKHGQPTGELKPGRRQSLHVIPIANPKKVRKDQVELALEEETTLNPLVNEIRAAVDSWRSLPNVKDWGVTYETQRLLIHWRDMMRDQQLFFCQIEAIETAIWLTEVAPSRAPGILDKIRAENNLANPGLFRIALKMATGTGKTMVMAMLIVWQSVNFARHKEGAPPGRPPKFSDGFLVITPGITIRDRLRVLLPSEPDNYYETRSLVPPDLLPDVKKAAIVIRNFHAFQLKKEMEISPLGQALLAGRRGEKPGLETPGQMLRRVCPELLSKKSVVVLNDEAHHCYRERPGAEDDGGLTAEEREEINRDKENARIWISGIEHLAGLVNLRATYDLSATPFFLRGSGFPANQLFGWVVSDFSLMDAIECGIVKVPRVPVADDAIRGREPVFRRLWDHIREEMPRKGRSKQKLDPRKPKLPADLESALNALYKHYEATDQAWKQAGKPMPPVFIVVCNNTASSKLVHDWLAGYEVTDGENSRLVPGALGLFSNVDENGRWKRRPSSLLIDSAQLESGEALSADFKKAAAQEIEEFKREYAARVGHAEAEKISDEEILREVMNTVGRPGKLGETIRCVVSVSMLTEGWDVNTVTHILGARAFGTQLLCEQVVGRGLRRSSYQANDDGHFTPEYAEVLGIPFSFAASHTNAVTPPDIEPTHIRAVEGREAQEIRFPRVIGYRQLLPPGRLVARFDDNARLIITPDDVATRADLEPIVGEGTKISLDYLRQMREREILFKLAGHVLEMKFAAEDGSPQPYLFPQVLRITQEWLADYFQVRGNVPPAVVIWRHFADQAAERIHRAVQVEGQPESGHLQAILNSYNAEGSSRHVRFMTRKTSLWETAPDKCQINYVVGDSDWELSFAQTLEDMPEVLAYVKNQGLDFHIPYTHGGHDRRYEPDFILRWDRGAAREPLNLVVEIKGARDNQDAAKAQTAENTWVPAVNNAGRFGLWMFIELTEPYDAARALRDTVAKKLAEWDAIKGAAE